MLYCTPFYALGKKIPDSVSRGSDSESLEGLKSQGSSEDSDYGPPTPKRPRKTSSETKKGTEIIRTRMLK